MLHHTEADRAAPKANMNHTRIAPDLVAKLRPERSFAIAYVIEEGYF